MMNAHSKLYSSSRLPSSRLWASNTTFIDARADDIINLINDEDNIAYIMSINLNKELVPIYSPTLANKDELLPHWECHQ
jgi:hypothetical protein